MAEDGLSAASRGLIQPAIGSPYRFRPFERGDLPMVADWLRTLEVVKWWGEPQEQLALIAGDIDEPMMRQWIVVYDDRPFAYVQAYPVQVWPQPHLTGLPAGTEMIDAFIGQPAMIGRGHGSAFLRAFAEMLIAEGAPAVTIDPDVENHRARRAYSRAGFVTDHAAETENGRVVLMRFQRHQAVHQ